MHHLSFFTTLMIIVGTAWIFFGVPVILADHKRRQRLNDQEQANIGDRTPAHAPARSVRPPRN